MPGDAESHHHRDHPDNDVGDAASDEAQAGERVEGAGSPRCPASVAAAAATARIRPAVTAPAAVSRPAPAAPGRFRPYPRLRLREPTLTDIGPPPRSRTWPAANRAAYCHPIPAAPRRKQANAEDLITEIDRRPLRGMAVAAPARDPRWRAARRCDPSGPRPPRAQPGHWRRPPCQALRATRLQTDRRIRGYSDPHQPSGAFLLQQQGGVLTQRLIHQLLPATLRRVSGPRPVWVTQVIAVPVGPPSPPAVGPPQPRSTVIGCGDEPFPDWLFPARHGQELTQR
jgi:hypothetical protein